MNVAARLCNYVSIVKNYGRTRSAALRVALCLKLPIAHDGLLACALFTYSMHI